MVSTRPVARMVAWERHRQAPSLCKLLGSLSNVNSLVLIGFQEIIARMNLSPAPPATTVPSYEYAPGSLLQAILDEDNDRLPTFRNLGSLALHECDIGDKLETLWRFLQNTPVLDKLTLQNCECKKYPRRNEQNDKSKTSTASSIFETRILASNQLVEIKCEDTQQINAIMSEIKIKLPMTTMIRVAAPTRVICYHFSVAPEIFYYTPSVTSILERREY